MDSLATRRDLLMGSLLAALPLALSADRAGAAVDPAMTIIKPPQDLTWVKAEGFPEKSVESAASGARPAMPACTTCSFAGIPAT
jgi:hypothetical protein